MRKGMTNLKVVAVYGGLGSQMFKYAMFLAIKQKGNGVCLIDSSLCEVKNVAHGKFLLEKVFQIDTVNHLFVWNHKKPLNGFTFDSYRIAVMDHLLRNYGNDRFVYLIDRGKVVHWKGGLQNLYRLKLLIKLIMKNILSEELKILILSQHIKFIFDESPDHIDGKIYNLDGVLYYEEFNHNSDLYFKDVHKEVLDTFQFLPFKDINNIQLQAQIENESSVALHVRLGDHKSDNIPLITSGYYKRAVQHIKNTVIEPKFYLFSDDPEWCINNKQLFGFSLFEEIVCINHNKGEENYRDMQLMTFCQHNILAISSFSWWGAYLSKRSDKIVVAPKGRWTNATVHY